MSCGKFYSTRLSSRFRVGGNRVSGCGYRRLHLRNHVGAVRRQREKLTLVWWAGRLFSMRCARKHLVLINTLLYGSEIELRNSKIGTWGAGTVKPFVAPASGRRFPVLEDRTPPTRSQGSGQARRPAVLLGASGRDENCRHHSLRLRETPPAPRMQSRGPCVHASRRETACQA